MMTVVMVMVIFLRLGGEWRGLRIPSKPAPLQPEGFLAIQILGTR